MESLFIVLALALAWYWYDGTVVKEKAVVSARRACERHSQQLLDETVVMARVRPQRDRSGRVRLLRHYRFEFSGDGEMRHGGEIVLLGQRVIALNLQLDDHTLYDNDEGPP